MVAMGGDECTAEALLALVKGGRKWQADAGKNGGWGGEAKVTWKRVQNATNTTNTMRHVTFAESATKHACLPAGCQLFAIGIALVSGFASTLFIRTNWPKSHSRQIIRGDGEVVLLRRKLHQMEITSTSTLTLDCTTKSLPQWRRSPNQLDAISPTDPSARRVPTRRCRPLLLAISTSPHPSTCVFIRSF